MSSIVDLASQFGDLIAWESSTDDRKNFLRQHLPTNLPYDYYLKVFKEDIELDFVIDKVRDVDVFHLTSFGQYHDELYYFRSGCRLFHGHKIWSKWHSFLPFLQELTPTHFVEQPCFFVGSRPNYTHQIVDFLPNLLLRKELNGLFSDDVMNIIGNPNPILSEAFQFLPDHTFPTCDLNHLSNYQGETISIQSNPVWRIKCIRFNELYLVRHISIFKSFQLLRSAFKRSFDNSIDVLGHTTDAQAKALFLARTDNRIINQRQLSEQLEAHYSVKTFTDLAAMSLLQKYHYLSTFTDLVIPPGSQNINAFCFSNSSCQLIQMVPRRLTRLFETPFHTLAGIRYNLPFLDRTAFWEPQSEGRSVNSAVWNISNIPPFSSLRNNMTEPRHL